MLHSFTSAYPLHLVGRQTVLKRYASKGEHTMEEIAWRVALSIARKEEENGYIDYADTEAQARVFYEEMIERRFTPAGRTLSDAGVPDCKLVSNCVVLHIRDSLVGEPDSILGTLSEAVSLQRQGSGIGFPFHFLRPHSYECVTHDGVSSGPISFMRAYDNMFRVIKQKNRHGANMGIMHIDHPEVLEFIRCKRDEGTLRTFNISVLLTDSFMETANSDETTPWMCEFGGKPQLPFFVVCASDLDGTDKMSPFVSMCAEERASYSTGDHYVPEWSASRIYTELCKYAWRNGEPGVAFYDTIQKTNPLPGLGSIEACNPCGEQYLHDGDVCNLGAVNLEQFVDSIWTEWLTHGKGKLPNALTQIDYEALGKTVEIAVRMLDDVIDMTEFESDRVQTRIRENRRVGLGVMGFADMLFKLAVPYDTEGARCVARSVMKCIQDAADRTTKRLAAERGAFPNFKLSVFSVENGGDGVLRRNAALTNVAPTGTTSLVTGVNGGIEPYFLLSYTYENVLQSTRSEEKTCRARMITSLRTSHSEDDLRLADSLESDTDSDLGTKTIGLHPEALKMLQLLKLDQDADLIAEICGEGSMKHIECIPEEFRRVFVVSSDFGYAQHTRMQAAFQEHVDNAISKTINLPHCESVESIKHVFASAWELGIKGCTVYRDGSRTLQVLNKNDDEETATSEDDSVAYTPATEVQILEAQKRKAQRKHEKLCENGDTAVQDMGSMVCVRGGKCG